MNINCLFELFNILIIYDYCSLFSIVLATIKFTNSASYFLLTSKYLSILICCFLMIIPTLIITIRSTFYGYEYYSYSKILLLYYSIMILTILIRIVYECYEWYSEDNTISK